MMTRPAFYRAPTKPLRSSLPNYGRATPIRSRPSPATLRPEEVIKWLHHSAINVGLQTFFDGLVSALDRGPA